MRGDATRLQQVFWNLINNSIRFTPAGGTVEVTASDECGRYLVRVKRTFAMVNLRARDDRREQRPLFQAAT